MTTNTVFLAKKDNNQKVESIKKRRVDTKKHKKA